MLLLLVSRMRITARKGLTTTMAFKKSSLKTSLDHVPAPIQAELDIAVHLIHDVCKKDVAMIWLFGSYARGDYINDRRVDEQGVVSEYNSDVDILVVLRGKESSKKSSLLKKFVGLVEESPKLSSTFHVIYETLDGLNKSLNRSEYFYLDVVNEGVVLFDDDVTLAQPQQLSPEQRREMSIDYFERFYQQAIESQQTFEYLYQKDSLSAAIFSLHQMTERLFCMYLLVYTHYKPRTHKLYELRTRVATLNPEIKTIFPSTSKEERKQFAFFGDAYVDSRYKPDYEVDPAVLDTLTNWVANFQHWVYNESMKTIDGFIPERNYSHSQTLPYRFLNLNTLKTQPLPEVVIERQEKALAQEIFLRKQKEVELEQSFKREENERQEKEQEILRRKQAEAEKNREKIQKEQALKQLEQEREKKVQLLQKLRDAGLE